MFTGSVSHQKEKTLLLPEKAEYSNPYALFFIVFVGDFYFWLLIRHFNVQMLNWTATQKEMRSFSEYIKCFNSILNVKEFD